MKKHYLQLSLSLLFLIITGMTCEDYDLETASVPCHLTDVEVYSWDNAEQKPEMPIEGKIKKEAYLLEIRLLSDAGTIPELEFRPYDLYKLEDKIDRIAIYTEQPLNKECPEGSEVTSCFQDYPVRLTPNHIMQDGSIYYFESAINQIFKALNAEVYPGTHRFRIVLTMDSGNVIERKTDFITLY